MKYISALLLLLTGLSAGAQTRKYAITADLSASITHSPGSKSVLVLIPGVEKIALELSRDPGNNFQIKTADYNQDGYKDFAFTSRDAAPNAPVIYEIFLYHPADKTFEALENPGGACEFFANIRIGVNDRTLRSSCRNGAKSSMDIFKWADAFSLELVKSTDNSDEARSERDEEKADEKAEKAGQRAEKREQRKEAREDQEDGD